MSLLESIKKLFERNNESNFADIPNQSENHNYNEIKEQSEKTLSDSTKLDSIISNSMSVTDNHLPLFKVVVDSSPTYLNRISELSNYECYVVFDTETSGLSPQRGNEILQIGAIKYNVKSGAVVDTLCLYIKPSAHCVVEQSALRVNGLNINELKRTGLKKSDAIKMFIEFIGTSPLFAYNSPFDLRFLNATCETIGIKTPKNPTYDILALIRRLAIPTENAKLATIAKHFGYQGGNFHDAIKDCDASNFVLRRICFDKEGNLVGDSNDDMYYNLHKYGVKLESYIEESMTELDVFSRLTGKLLFTKSLRQCNNMGIYVSFNRLSEKNGFIWTNEYGVKLHEEGINSIAPDIAYGKRMVDVFSRETGELLFTKTLDECAAISGSLTKKKIAQAIEDKSWAGNYGFRAHEEGVTEIVRDFTFGKRYIDSYTKEGDFLKRYENVSDIVTDLGFAGTSPINTMLRQEKITYNLNGYIFIYATSKEPLSKIEGAVMTKLAKRPIYIFDLEGNLLGVFSKMTECSEQYKLQTKMISKCLTEGKPQYNGYIFRYSDTPLTEEELKAAKENYAYREVSGVETNNEND